MTLLTDFQNLINEHGSSTILRERLLQVADRLKETEDIASSRLKKITELNKEISDLSRENTSLAAKLEDWREKEKFIEHRGALFKKKPSGGYHEAVYCPSCRFAMGLITSVAPFNCNPCHRKSSFSGKELPRIMEELDSSV